MESKVYTMEDWQRDKTLSPAIGQLVDNDVVWELIECVFLQHIGVLVSSKLGKPIPTTKRRANLCTPLLSK